MVPLLGHLRPGRQVQAAQVPERGQQVRVQQEADRKGQLRGRAEVLPQPAEERRRPAVSAERVERMVQLQRDVRERDDDEGQEVQEQDGGEDLRRWEGKASEAAGEHRVLHGYGWMQSWELRGELEGE